MRKSLGQTILCLSIPWVMATSASAGALASQVETLQQRLEDNLERSGSITEIVYESPTSDHVVNLDEMEDSAIWTGVYLASQCFRFASVQNPAEKTAARQQISWALDSIDRLFEVTGTEGLPARFAFNPTDPAFQDLKIAHTASVQSGWTASSTLPGWLWMGGTSRDQYTGIMYGLGVCNQITPDEDVRSRTAARIDTVVRVLAANDWKIPVHYTQHVTSNQIPFFARLAWIALAKISNPESLAWASSYKKASQSLRWDLGDWIEPSGYSNLMEYYGWNLGYLRYYTLLTYEKSPKDHEYIRKLFDLKVWEKTWSHKNAMFTFMKLGMIGEESPRDGQALDDAKQSLTELAFKNRRDFAVRNSTRTDIGRNPLAEDLGWIIQETPLHDIHFFTKLDAQQADQPLAMKDRPPSDFMWQRSPFQLDGGSGGTIESPSVDTIFAYWLGRYHGLLSEQE